MPRTWAFLFCLAVLAGCGDDDSVAPDAGGDGGGDAGDAGGFIPRRDSSVPPGDPVPDCDPAEVSACGAGQKCAWVLRFDATGQGVVYTGCVDQHLERELGAPCSQFSRAVEAPGLTDETYVDPCGEGLFCGDDPDRRGVFTCQSTCTTSAECSPTQYCAGTLITGSSIAVPVCRPSDDCAPLAQTGCGGGDTCYLRANGARDGALAVCLPHEAQEPMGGAPGASCIFDGYQYISACQPGTVCWGDPRVSPAQWDITDIYCRSLCDPAAEDSDAGGGTCSGDCVYLGDPALGIDVTAVSAPPGVCG